MEKSKLFQNQAWEDSTLCHICYEPFDVVDLSKAERAPITAPCCGQTACRKCINSFFAAKQEAITNRIKFFPCLLCNSEKSFHKEKLPAPHLGYVALIAAVRNFQSEIQRLSLEVSTSSKAALDAQDSVEKLIGELKTEKVHLENELSLTILKFAAEARVIALERDEALEAKQRLEEEIGLLSARLRPISREFSSSNQARDRLQQAPEVGANSYMEVHLTSAEDVAQLDRFTSSLNDIVPTSGCGYTVRIRREAEVWQMLATIEVELGVPIERMRLWKLKRRHNHTRRPMGCLQAKNLMDVVARKYASRHNGRCAFYIEVLPVECSDGGNMELLNPDAPFTGLQPFPPNPLCSLPKFVDAVEERSCSSTAAASHREMTKSREEELYDPKNRCMEIRKLAQKFTDFDLGPTHGLIFVKFYNPDYVRALHGGDGHGEGGFLLPRSGTRPYNERELVFLGSALVRLDAIAKLVIPRVCAALLGRASLLESPLLRLMESIEFENVQPLGKGTLTDCKLNDGDIICCQKQSDVTTVFVLMDDDEGALEEENCNQNSTCFVTPSAPGIAIALPRKVEDYFKYRVHRRILRFYPKSSQQPQVVDSSLLPPVAVGRINGHDVNDEPPNLATAAAATYGEIGGFALGVTRGFELELSSMMTVEQVLTALANAIGFSEPLRLKLWGVNCEGDTPQPSHFPYNITVHSLNKNAFDGHGLRLGGAEVYGSSGVLFYEVVPYSLLELRDNVVVELEVAHHHWAWVAGTCANDKGLGTPSDVPTENVAPLWPDAPLSYPPLRNCSGVEAASEDENGSSSSSISGPLSPALLLPGNRGDDRIDDELSRIREVDGGKRVITKFDPVGGTCSITFLVPRGSTVKDVAESARRLLRVPLFYEVRLNEVDRMRVVHTFQENKPVADIARSPLNLANYTFPIRQRAIVKTALEFEYDAGLRMAATDSKLIQVVVFSLTQEADRKRKQNMAAEKEDTVRWDANIHGIGHLTYITPHDDFYSVRSRVLDRVPMHFREFMTYSSSRPAIIYDDGKAVFLKPSEKLRWEKDDEISTSQLYARVGHIIDSQLDMAYTKRPTLGFEIPDFEMERRAKKICRLEERIRHSD